MGMVIHIDSDISDGGKRMTGTILRMMESTYYEEDKKYNITPVIEFEAYEDQSVTIAGTEILLKKGDRIIVERVK